MILPCASRSMRSIGWITRQRTRTTSPALMLDGTRIRILPTSLTALPSAAADGHLDLALRGQQRAVALLDDRAHVRGLAEAHVGADEGLAGVRRERGARNDRDAVLVGDDPDVLDVGGRRHRRVDLDRDRHDGAVFGDRRDVELDDSATVLHRAAAEDPLEAVLDGLLAPERRRYVLSHRAPGARQRARCRRDASDAKRPERRAACDRLCHPRFLRPYFYYGVPVGAYRTLPSSRNADASGLNARGSQSGRRRLPGPGAGRASASHWR